MIDAWLDDIRAIVRATFPRIGFLGTYEYAVFEANPPTYDLRPTDPVAGLPPIPACRVKPGIPGLTSEIVEGALVYVTFINSDPSRAFIIAVAGPGDAGFTPDMIKLEAESVSIAASGVASLDGVSVHLGNGGVPLIGAPPVRAGDTVQIGSTSGVISIVTPFGTPPTPTKVLA